MTDDARNTPSPEELTSPPAEPEAGHDAWVRAQVERALHLKKQGAQYATLDAVAEKFKADAR